MKCPERRDGFPDQPFTILLSRNVGLHWQGPCPKLLCEVLCHFLIPFLPSGTDYYVGSGPGQGDDDCLADAAVAAGDNRNPVLKHHKFCLFLGFWTPLPLRETCQLR